MLKTVLKNMRRHYMDYVKFQFLANQYQKV